MLHGELCRLCREERELARSHVIPEFLYQPLYCAKHRVPEVYLDQGDRIRLLQKGLRERLLCTSCEAHLNLRYEVPFFNAWVRDEALPEELPWQPYNLPVYDYRALRLFLLSVLFRASVSTLPEFSDVQLGPFEKELRQSLLAGDPGDPHRIAIGAIHMERDKTNRNNFMIIGPVRTRFRGSRAYLFTFAGCAWLYIVSSQSSAHLQEVLLSPKGFLPLVSMHWREVALSSKDPSRGPR